MNNTYFISLIRRDQAVQIAGHLAAGILALVLLVGYSVSESAGARKAEAAPTSAVMTRSQE